MDYGRLKARSQLRKGWHKQCEELKRMDDVLMPLGDGKHWMMADIRPKTNKHLFMDSYNQSRISETKSLINFLKLSGLLRENYRFEQLVPSTASANKYERLWCLLYSVC